MSKKEVLSELKVSYVSDYVSELVSKKIEKERLLKSKFKNRVEEHKKGLLFSGEKVRIHMGEHIYSRYKHRTPAIVVALFTVGLMVMSMFLFGFQNDCDN